jgi:Domain of Unknown Function (DUF1080)
VQHTHIPIALLAGLIAVSGEVTSSQSKDNTPPPGFIALFNGKDLAGWQALLELPGLKSGAGLDPAEPLKLSAEERTVKQREADAKYLPHWTVRDGVLHYDGQGQNLRSVKDYGDIELFVDWRIPEKGDTGIYLRGTPQIQIWQRPGVGSGGLFNNQKGARNPLKEADRPVGEWNTFRILNQGDVVTVWLNGELVVDKVVYENYWDRSRPLPATGPIELQHHGNPIAFKNIYVRELK